MNSKYFSEIDHQTLLVACTTGGLASAVLLGLIREWRRRHLAQLAYAAASTSPSLSLPPSSSPPHSLSSMSSLSSSAASSSPPHSLSSSSSSLRSSSPPHPASASSSSSSLKSSFAGSASTSLLYGGATSQQHAQTGGAGARAGPGAGPGRTGTPSQWEQRQKKEEKQKQPHYQQEHFEKLMTAARTLGSPVSLLRPASPTCESTRTRSGRGILLSPCKSGQLSSRRSGMASAGPGGRRARATSSMSVSRRLNLEQWEEEDHPASQWEKVSFDLRLANGELKDRVHTLEQQLREHQAQRERQAEQIADLSSQLSELTCERDTLLLRLKISEDRLAVASLSEEPDVHGDFYASTTTSGEIEALNRRLAEYHLTCADLQEQLNALKEEKRALQLAARSGSRSGSPPSLSLLSSSPHSPSLSSSSPSVSSAVAAASFSTGSFSLAAAPSSPRFGPVQTSPQSHRPHMLLDTHQHNIPLQLSSSDVQQDSVFSPATALLLARDIRS